MADKALYQTTGGQYTCTLAANTAVNTAVNSTASVPASGQGRLCKVVVQGNTVNTVIIYDNSTGPGGPILFQSIANTAVSTLIHDLQFPFYNGLWVNVATNGPAVALSFGLSAVGGA